LKLRYKLVAWTLDQFQALQNVQDLEVVQVDLLQCMVWVVATWKELDAETICNAWREAEILLQDWNADIINCQEWMKSGMDAGVAELGNVIAALDLGKIEAGNSTQTLVAVDYIDMVGNNIIEAGYSTSEIVELVDNGGCGKVRNPILLGYTGFYTMYYKDIEEFQILYSQDICW
jgi:hypothetical protein